MTLNLTPSSLVRVIQLKKNKLLLYSRIALLSFKNVHQIVSARVNQSNAPEIFRYPNKILNVTNLPVLRKPSSAARRFFLGDMTNKHSHKRLMKTPLEVATYFI